MPVVARRPSPVTLDGRDGRELDPTAEQLLVCQELTNFVKATQNELLIMLTSKRPQQRRALKAEQIGEWVLKDHGTTLCRAGLDAQRFPVGARGPCTEVPIGDGRPGTP